MKGTFCSHTFLKVLLSKRGLYRELSATAFLDRPLCVLEGAALLPPLVQQVDCLQLACQQSEQDVKIRFCLCLKMEMVMCVILVYIPP